MDCLGRATEAGDRVRSTGRSAVTWTGIASPTLGFLAVTSSGHTSEVISYGFLLRDGVIRDLVSGHQGSPRSAERLGHRHRDQGTDADGRTFRAVGRRLSGIIINRHTFIDSNGLIEWNIDGEIGHGEDQDLWPVHAWADQRRKQRR